jgi:hypothetical protein
VIKKRQGKKSGVEEKNGDRTRIVNKTNSPIEKKNYR